MSTVLDFALSALLIWCQHLLKSGQLNATQSAQLEKLLKDINRISHHEKPR